MNIITIAKGDAYVKMALNLFKSAVDNGYSKFTIVGDKVDFEYKGVAVDNIVCNDDFQFIEKLDLFFMSIKKRYSNNNRYFVFLDADSVIYNYVDFKQILSSNIISCLLEEDILTLPNVTWAYKNRQAILDLTQRYNITKCRHMNGGLLVADGYFVDTLVYFYYDIKKYMIENDSFFRFNEETITTILVEKLAFDYKSYYGQSSYIVDSKGVISNFKEVVPIYNATYFSDNYSELVHNPDIIHFAKHKRPILNYI